MFFTEEKLANRIEELHQHLFRQVRPIGQWVYHEDLTKAEKYPPKPDATWQTIQPGDTWAGRDGYFWFETTLQVPEFSADEKLGLIFDLGKTELANLGGFESLLFVNGVPQQGIDTYHKAYYLDAARDSGQTIQLALKAWTGLEGGGEQQVQHHLFNYANIGVLDVDVKDFYYLSKNLSDTIADMDANDPLKPQLLNDLNRAWRLVDWSQPDSDAFYQSLHTAHDCLEEAVSHYHKQPLAQIDAVGHTHIDVAWLWRYKHTREKVARSFATVLELMKEYPEYVFFQSSPQMYAFIKQDYPELYAQIKQRVKEGRWEVDGAMWLEADCNIPSGEALVRQILMGKQFIRQEFDRESHVLWLPDVFGYSWALPQILKKSGVDTFITTKISWNEFNQMPHDTFMWRGIDGSEVLTQFITTPEPDRYGDKSFRVRYTYNGYLQPNIIKGTYDNYHDKRLNSELLLAYGYGDGGGGVNRDMLENRRQMDRIPGLPAVKPKRVDEFVDHIRKQVETTDQYVQHWDGELYLEFHRGTYTSQAHTKRLDRKLELALRDAEILSTLSWLAGADYPVKVLSDQWQTLALNQFHDVIPGSSIKEVYQDAEQMLGDALNVAKDIVVSGSDAQGDVTIYNTSPWSRTEWVQLPESLAHSRLLDENGADLPRIETQAGVLMKVSDLPAMSRRRLIVESQLVAGKKTETSHVIDDHTVCNDTFIVSWNDDGMLTRIYDRKHQREVLATGALGNQLQLFEDKPLDFDAWNLDVFYQDKLKALKASDIQVVTDTDDVVEVQFKYDFGTSHLTQTMRLLDDTGRIDFVTSVDWHERQQFLKAAFPVDVRATEATYDIQFGNVKRPTHWNTSWDLAKFETVGHQWADLSESNYGVALLNDCKYGYDIKDNVMRLSLLKGAIFPDPTADIGHQEFTYAIYPHAGTVLESDTAKAAWQLNSPLVLREENTPTQPLLFDFNGADWLNVDAVKLAEAGDGVVLRFHEFVGGRHTLQLKALFEYDHVSEVNLMEDTLDDEVDLDTLVVKPYEIKTFKFFKK